MTYSVDPGSDASGGEGGTGGSAGRLSGGCQMVPVDRGSLQRHPGSGGARSRDCYAREARDLRDWRAQPVGKQVDGEDRLWRRVERARLGPSGVDGRGHRALSRLPLDADLRNAGKLATILISLLSDG
jgi:hypothetical protein